MKVYWERLVCWWNIWRYLKSAHQINFCQQNYLIKSKLVSGFYWNRKTNFFMASKNTHVSKFHFIWNLFCYCMGTTHYHLKTTRSEHIISCTLIGTHCRQWMIYRMKEEDLEFLPLASLPALYTCSKSYRHRSFG